MRVSSSERYDPTAMTSVATPPPTTSEIASACAQSRFRSRSSLRSSARIASPCELSGGAQRLVQAFGRDLSVREGEHAMRHVLDRGIVCDDERGRAKELVGPKQGVDDHDAGLRIERPSRLVAQQNLGLLDDGAGDGDPLLLASRELGRK